MTREEIMKMEAGREMDLLIGKIAYPDAKEFLVLPNYSTDISAAWEVDRPEWKWDFEESSLGLYVYLYPTGFSQDKEIRVFVPWNGKDKQSAYCLGRCRAALLAVAE